MEKTISKSEQNKMKKHNMLIQAAYELFTSKGVNNTTISDIVSRAGIAKGTFYLYFKDKYELMDAIVLRRSAKLLDEAMQIVNNNDDDFVDKIIYIVNYIIVELGNDTKLLRLINKNLSVGLYIKVIKTEDDYSEILKGAKMICDNLINLGHTFEEAEKILYMIIELVSSVAYTCILGQNPYTIDEIKPILFNTIRKIVK